MFARASVFPLKILKDSFRILRNLLHLNEFLGLGKEKKTAELDQLTQIELRNRISL